MASKNQNTKVNKKKKKKKGKLITFFFLLLILMGMLAFLLGLKLFEKKTGQTLFECIREGKEIAAASTREDFLRDNITYIYADDGSQIAEISENKESSYITYDEIPKAFVDGFVAIEDRTFWTNSGIDLKGMVRVLYTFIKSMGETANGASTITQQLVKLTYLSSEKTLSRKVKEIVIALDITKKYSKEDIIEFYCNTCCFANGIYGIQDAAREYFDCEVDELSLSQIAYLCAIPNWPEHYNPKSNPENALTRRDKILGDMLEEGYITQAEHDQAVSEEIAIADVTETQETHNFETTYAINCAVKYLMEVNDFEFRYEWEDDADYQAYQDEYAESYAQAKHELYTGGYKIYTTINMKAQKKIQSIVDDELSDFTKKLDSGVYQVQGSATVIDNDTGKVIAVIGGRSQDETKGMFTLNRAYQGYQQPGSSIKPLIVYTPAMNSGDYNTSSVLNNIEVSNAKGKKVSEIKNMEGTATTLRYAVENSLNGCAYWLFANIGVKTGMEYITNMQFAKIVPDDYNMSACLGGLNYGTTTEEMANAYYTLENDGIYKDTDCLLSIIDGNGKECYEEPEEKRIYSEEASRKMTDVMKGVLTDGTAKKSKWYKSTSTEAAGKTGTTNDNKSAWFCGYTPYYTISVWVGCDTPKAISGLTGSSYPLSIWKKAMLYLIDGKPTAAFPSIEEEEEELVCICALKCTELSVNEECPVCAVDLSLCTGEEGVCVCEEKCEGDTLNELCPVCMSNPELCTGIEMICTCTYTCTEDEIDMNCPVCSIDYGACECTNPHVEEPDPEPETPQPEPSSEPKSTEKKEHTDSSEKESEKEQKDSEADHGGSDEDSHSDQSDQDQDSDDEPDAISDDDAA